MKICTKCKTENQLTNFRKNPANKDGLQSWCKPCQNKGKREWMLNNPQKVSDYAKHRYKLLPERAKGRQLQKFWKGSTWDQALTNYLALFNAQNGKCGGCHKHQTVLKQKLAVDHCHATGKVRGLLCPDCNLTLGKFEDKPQLLRNLATYLESHT